MGRSCCDRPTDRPTDHATRSVAVGRMCVCSTAVQHTSSNGSNNNTNANVRGHQVHVMNADAVPVNCQPLDQAS